MEFEPRIQAENYATNKLHIIPRPAAGQRPAGAVLERGGN
ncbi:hypothetical protein PLANPX_0515 [Lacipirellula parvula]|uniref:Uncharacterized protein n=1 Tax=Lacipirellula parvula TaxID=2650471 RepID=A0A5K7X8Z2_9BACT|nr:hypothetical protein PLANPX_0515 [Lacipirellula parvula]